MRVRPQTLEPAPVSTGEGSRASRRSSSLRPRREPAASGPPPTRRDSTHDCNIEGRRAARRRTDAAHATAHRPGRRGGRHRRRARGLPDRAAARTSTCSGRRWRTSRCRSALIIALLAGWIGFSLASARAPWRVVDIVVASVLGVAGGLLFAVWNANYATISAPLSATPAVALLGGVWLLPGVLGALVIRRPGAAVFIELVAAVVEGADRQPVGLLGGLVRPARGPGRRDRLRRCCSTGGSGCRPRCSPVPWPA